MAKEAKREVPEVSMGAAPSGPQVRPGARVEFVVLKQSSYALGLAKPTDRINFAADASLVDAVLSPLGVEYRHEGKLKVIPFSAIDVVTVEG